MFEELFYLPGWTLAIAHLIFVIAYARWKQWGVIVLFGPDGLFRPPGGSIALAVPVMELITIWFAWPYIDTLSGWLVTVLAFHMLRVRLILLALFAVPTLVTRIVSGKCRVMCMDKRLDRFVVPGDTFAMHNGVCGAFVTLTLGGFMPGIVLVGILLMFGIAVPAWVTILSAVPYLFLFAKHWHIIPSTIPDALEMFFEGLGTFLSSVVFHTPWTFQSLTETHE